MFEELRRWNQIIVTGPQRSGTTIVARMIAMDTGHTFVPEETWGIHGVEKLEEYLDDHPWIVVQAPTMLVNTPELADDRTLVVLVRRTRSEKAVSGDSPPTVNDSGIRGSNRS